MSNESSSTQRPRAMPRRGGAMMMAPKEKVPKGTLKRLLGYIMKSYKVKFIAVIICIIISSITGVLGILSLGTVIDDYITPLIGTGSPDYTGLLNFMIKVAIILIIGVIATYIYNRLMAQIAQGVLRDVRDEMFEKMQSLPIKYFDTHTHGEIMSHYTNDTDTLRQMISQSLPNIISSTITIVSTVVSMFIKSVPLTLFVLVFSFLTLMFIKTIATKSSKYFVSQQESLAKVNGYVEEMLNGQKVIKVFTHEGKTKEEFDELNDKLNSDMYNANRYANSMMPIAGNLANLEYVSVAIVGSLIALRVANPVEYIGTLVAFLQLTRNFTGPINQVMNQFNSIIMALAGAGRIFNMMDEEPEVDEGYVTLVNAKIVDGKIEETEKATGKWAWKYPHEDGTIEYVELKGYIEMLNVDFSYDGKKQILNDVTVYAKPGQKIAFVGATGAGKTTITNLINRFYDIEDGKIKYDGININKIKKDDLRRSLGMVLQETNLFTGTIKDNIKYGKSDANDDEVIEAAKLANAHDFITRLPNGYDTMLTGNGSQLSQGQRQLLAIARAAINNPPVMILDEATSSIDTRTEKIVQDGMDKLMDGRTVFVIAHRLSTVRNSKAIIVLDHGKIIERGEHDFLIAQKGQYYQLYTGAFELE
ncbi:MAG: ABC transporter ATP-binding protein [Clostridia bacterium]|nr:ABC transporter ATP-binding protein [Clostridia bacterium]